MRPAAAAHGRLPRLRPEGAAARRPGAGHVRRHPARRPEGGRRRRLRRQLGRGPLAGERAEPPGDGRQPARAADRRLPDPPRLPVQQARPARGRRALGPLPGPQRAPHARVPGGGLEGRGGARDLHRPPEPHGRGPLPALRDAAAAARADGGGLDEAGGGRDVRRHPAGGAGGGAGSGRGRGPGARGGGAPQGPRPHRRGRDSRGARRPGDPHDRCAHRVLRAGLRRARLPGQRAARGAGPPARAPRRGAAGPRAGDRGPGEDRRRGAPPGHPEGAREGGRGLGGHAAALHRRLGPAPGAASARGRPPLPHHLGGDAHRGGEGAHRAAARGGLPLAPAGPGPVPGRAGLRGRGPRAAALRRAPAGARPAVLRPLRGAAPAGHGRAPRLPRPRARGPARGRRRRARPPRPASGSRCSRGRRRPPSPRC